MAADAPTGPPDTEAHPASWAADVVLRDGHTVHVRPILPSDSEGLARFHGRQSPESVYFRFFSPRPVLSDKELQYFTNVDHHDRVAFVAVLEDEIIGVARYERYRGTDTAEVAFFVDDANHGRGLATVMLEYLAAAGRQRGLRRFTATTLPANHRMLAVFSSAGYDVVSGVEDGVIAISFDIDRTDESAAAVDRRERQAEAATVTRLLRPSAVVVLGTPSPTGLGAAVARLIARGGYTGKLHWSAPAGQTPRLEGPEAGEIAVVEEIPPDTDLAIIAVPAGEVPDLVDRCGEAGVGAIVIVSAGFTDTPAAGERLEREVVERARHHGVRVLGPDCLGVVNSDPEVRLNATISPASPPRGRIGVLTGTGTLAASILEHAERTQLGVSTFVAGGSPLDVGPADLLSYWAEDDSTDGVLVYSRAHGLPARAVSAARSASLRKPVATLGRLLLAGRDEDPEALRRRVAALTRQTGVISVGTLEQLFDIGRLLADQPVPRGRGVVVVGNSGGAVGVTADACRAAGLHLVDLAGTTFDGLSDAVTVGNPLNLTYRATAEQYRAALRQLASMPGVDSVLVVHTPPRLQPIREVMDVIVDASREEPEVTFAATMFKAAGTPRLGVDGGERVPVFSFPEHAARAIGRLAAYRSWRDAARARGSDPPLGCDVDRAREVAERALERGGGGSRVTLDLAEQEELLESFAIRMAARRVVGDADEAAAAAWDLGWPVALKAARRDRRSRSAASGVAIDLADEADLRGTWDRMHSVLGEDMFPMAVQRFIERGVDAAVVLEREAAGTATLTLGLGGPVRAFDDPQVGILPLTLQDAQSLVGTSALGRALSDPLDRVALVGVVQRLALLMETVDRIVRIEADPIVSSVEGAWVADVEVVVAPPRDELDVRRLG